MSRTGQSTESRAFGTFVTILACARSRAESKRDAVTGDVRQKYEDPPRHPHPIAPRRCSR